ncbi:MAG: MBL fold metallo-hydrolase [bacterium]|jgi:flavorubredoxin
MRSETIYENGPRRWIAMGRDPNKPDSIIDTNEFLILDGDSGILLDPGGVKIFPKVLAELTRYVAPESICTIALSHQDPDIGSSLALWLDLCPNTEVYCSWLWSGFITHFGMGKEIELQAIPDEGMVIPFGRSSIQAIPAHYCHASGNFSFYDAEAKILFSGDIGSALLPDAQAGLVVKDFQQHIRFMEGFHKRWMPSTSALRDWVQRARALRPDMICPQHGAIFQGEDVTRFLDWLESLEVGVWGK